MYLFSRGLLLVFLFWYVHCYPHQQVNTNVCLTVLENVFASTFVLIFFFPRSLIKVTFPFLKGNGTKHLYSLPPAYRMDSITLRVPSPRD